MGLRSEVDDDVVPGDHLIQQFAIADINATLALHDRDLGHPYVAKLYAELDAVRDRDAARAERAILVLIDGASRDIDDVVAARRALPSLSRPAPLLRGRGAVVSPVPDLPSTPVPSIIPGPAGP
jgi:hypothetical protein